MKQNPTDPTNFPAGDRRPTTVAGVFRAAARILAANGLYQGDYLPDPFDREMCIPHFLRPMSIVAAVKRAVTGDPHTESLVANEAISVLALRLGDGPQWGDIASLERHVDNWGDTEGRTTESAVAVLYAAADASEQVAA
ncbi:hypothetical protein ABZ371_00910 [Streptomyces sp. NPDC005899]|uniref:DUF6197 family protein n=1 Tax=Streptomyces sp. NPDC005899 TaxID=3155716 RepID=UPI0033C8FF10